LRKKINLEAVREADPREPKYARGRYRDGG
jgi:hypothetical protein